MMKSILMAVLMAVVVLSVVFSCATVPEALLAPGEVRLLGMEVPENGNLVFGLSYNIYFNFEADGKPEISRACCYWSGEPDHQYCYKVKDIRYGSPGNFGIDFSAAPLFDQQRLKCHVDYVGDGKRRRTNAITSFIFVYSR